MKGKERQKNGSCVSSTTSDNPFCLSTSNMIIHYSTKVKKFSKKNIYKYEETENFNIKGCPHCGSDDYIRWGNYERNIVYFKNGIKYEETIKIKRIKCNNCNKTHSIIPAFLIPYKVHTLEYIIEVLKKKEKKEGIIKLEEKI